MTGQDRGHPLVHIVGVEPNLNDSTFTSGFTEGGTYILGSDTVPHFDAVFMTGLSKCSKLMYLHPSLNRLAALPIVDLTRLADSSGTSVHFCQTYRQFPTYVMIPFLEFYVPQNLYKSELTAPQLVYHTSLVMYMFL
jgi:hypothetical protein